MSKFSDLLNKRLADKNLAKLARDLKIPRTVLHDWVSARREPSFRNVHHLRALAQYLGLSLDELLTDQSRERVISAIAFEDGGRKYRVKVERIG
ncbi:MAG: helix-turn-helix transcriptional regulator [Candidatus Melainabacteria bacterium]|nr:helix-turn-helix transcriptional regulator [Candidatus Melainabacteria bacterium]